MSFPFIGAFHLIFSFGSLKDNKPLKEDDHVKVLFQSKEVFEIIIEHVKVNHC